MGSTDKGTLCFTAKPKCARDLRSFGILRSVERWFLTDVSGQLIGSIFKVQTDSLRDVRSVEW